ncbi:MAG: glycosyltransferase [Planctomycetaceae bacterium]
MCEFISIIVATKDALPWLRRLVAACRAAQLDGAKLVIVDGASRDGTVEWLESEAPAGETGDLRWMSRSDSGIAEAWNRGVTAARGEWVVFLGADDLPAEATAWRRAADCLKGLSPACEIAAFPICMVSPAQTVIGEQVPTLGAECGEFFAVNTLPHQGVFHRRAILSRLGGFDGRFPVACDYEFLVRAVVAGAEVRLCEGPPPVRMTFGGASKHDPLANLREFRRIQVLHGVRRFRAQWWCAWARALGNAWGRLVIGEAGSRRIADGVRRLRGLPGTWTVP